MWITKNYSGKIQQEYKIESKLLEIKGIRHNLEIFNSKTFESIALIDEQIFLKTMLAQAGRHLLSRANYQVTAIIELDIVC